MIYKLYEVDKVSGELKYLNKTNNKNTAEFMEILMNKILIKLGYNNKVVIYKECYNNGYADGDADGREWAYAHPPEGQMSGIFGILTQGFDSLASILSISLFPGFTLGTLLFLPVVVGVG